MCVCLYANRILLPLMQVHQTLMSSGARGRNPAESFSPHQKIPHQPRVCERFI